MPTHNMTSVCYRVVVSWTIQVFSRRAKQLRAVPGSFLGSLLTELVQLHKKAAALQFAKHPRSITYHFLALINGTRLPSSRAQIAEKLFRHIVSVSSGQYWIQSNSLGGQITRGSLQNKAKQPTNASIPAPCLPPSLFTSGSGQQLSRLLTVPSTGEDAGLQEPE
jgi:hypothetical protein